jgi:hypothetical protein
MTLQIVAFVPAAPLLVPAVAGGSAPADEELRAACRSVAASLVAADPGRIVVAAGWPAGGSWDDAHTWGFEGFGVQRQPADDRPRLPWPLGIGAWLLDDVGWTGARSYVAADGVGSGLDDDTALLVVGDGTARRTEKAPGHLDDRAEAYDAEIARCLRDGDIAGLGGLDPELGAELMCGGLAVWHWLVTSLAGHSVAAAELLADTAPYGVGYFAATWTLTPDPK